MKLLRYGTAGNEIPALLAGDGTIRDLSSHIPDINAATISDAALAKLAAIDPAALPVLPAGQRIGVPVAGIGKIVAIGLNYADHAAEANVKVPLEPMIFMKAITSLNGPNDDVIMPRGSRKMDWEVELGVVIGRTARYVEAAEALDYVAGYVTANDVSERYFQIERGGTWDKGKGCDTFAPLGPYLVTRDEVSDPQNLRLWLDVNGVRRQNGTTADMICGVAGLVALVSQYMSLVPGDVILTGTPPGVGLGQKPEPIFLKAGDRMRVGVEGLGEQEQLVVVAP